MTSTPTGLVCRKVTWKLYSPTWQGTITDPLICWGVTGGSLQMLNKLLSTQWRARLPSELAPGMLWCLSCLDLWCDSTNQGDTTPTKLMNNKGDYTPHCVMKTNHSIMNTPIKQACDILCNSLRTEIQLHAATFLSRRAFHTITLIWTSLQRPSLHKNNSY